jgi:hypothetical protein
MPPVGKRAYVLKMGINLLRREEIAVPDSWTTALVTAARGLSEASSPSHDDEGIAESLQMIDVPPAVLLSKADWRCLRAMAVGAPLEEVLLHKAAIEFILNDRGQAVPAELVEMTLALT